jgi:aromatic-L-amino-acid/L-tryptophan decarboxylase
VIRNFGIRGLQTKIREHIELAKLFEDRIAKENDFELILPRNLTVVCFRYKPSAINNDAELNKLNAALLEKINASGKLYMSHTTINGKFVIRFVCAQTNTKIQHVEQALETIISMSCEL